MKDDQFDKLFSYLQKIDRRLEYAEENMALELDVIQLELMNLSGSSIINTQ